MTSVVPCSYLSCTACTDVHVAHLAYLAKFIQDETQCLCFTRYRAMGCVSEMIRLPFICIPSNAPELDLSGDMESLAIDDGTVIHGEADL